ncbi:MAG: LacI family DNA-binding transcriptional regulator, partial [Aeromonas veronii]
MATIKDVSQLANVSISTVSRVINNTAQVAPEKREAVLAAMKELNFRPNSFAQALVSKRSNCIGVLVGDLCGGPFFAQMMRGIETMVDQANKFTIVMSGNHDIARERHAIQALLQRQCDALILHSKALPDEELSELAAGSTPIVFINRQVPGAEDRCVWLDNQAGITTACQHLLDAGHRNIAFITSDDEEFVDGQQRMAGYTQTLARAGIAFDPALVSRAYADENGGYVAMSEL